MTAAEILLVQNSFRRITRVSDQVAALFYARLFELDPSLRELFHGDMAEQGRKLMQMLGFAVGSLASLDALLPAVRELGARHAACGVQEEHYATVGAALLWTLEKGLGDGFTPAVRDAWTKTYVLLATAMMSANLAAHQAAA